MYAALFPMVFSWVELVLVRKAILCGKSRHRSICPVVWQGCASQFDLAMNALLIVAVPIRWLTILMVGVCKFLNLFFLLLVMLWPLRWHAEELPSFVQSPKG